LLQKTKTHVAGAETLLSVYDILNSFDWSIRVWCLHER